MAQQCSNVKTRMRAFLDTNYLIEYPKKSIKSDLESFLTSFANNKCGPAFDNEEIFEEFVVCNQWRIKGARQQAPP